MFDNTLSSFADSSESPGSTNIPRILLDLAIGFTPLLTVGLLGEWVGDGTALGAMLINVAYVLSILLATIVLWARGSGWRQLGMARPKSWPKTIVLAVVLFFVVIFSLKNILTHKHMLMTTIKNVGAFVALAAVAYFGFAEGVETPLRDGEILSASGSRWVGTGLYLFYFLVVIAVGAMFITGFKRMIKK